MTDFLANLLQLLILLSGMLGLCAIGCFIGDRLIDKKPWKDIL